MLEFTKMEGLGNDYIYIDEINQDVIISKSFIKKVSDRHFGIGSDGVVVALASKQYDFKMKMFNKDGSEGKMCGNGLRCFAKFLYDEGLTDKTHLEIETASGKRDVWLHLDQNEVTRVTIDIGKPVLCTKDIPMNIQKEAVIDDMMTIQGRQYKITALSLGNPHAVLFVSHLDFDIREIGSAFENSELFPESVNVEFVKVIDSKHLEMRVWERGSHETMACGTGGAAAMYAAYLNGKCEDKVDVILPGGHLDVEYKEGHLFINGPARTVFRGSIEGGEFDE